MKKLLYYQRFCPVITGIILKRQKSLFSIIYSRNRLLRAVGLQIVQDLRFVYDKSGIAQRINCVYYARKKNYLVKAWGWTGPTVRTKNVRKPSVTNSQRSTSRTVTRSKCPWTCRSMAAWTNWPNGSLTDSTCRRTSWKVTIVDNSI